MALLQWRCAACDHVFGDLKQLRENTKRLQARKSRYDGLLMGQEIVALRKRYGLTQQAAAKVFGKGKIAFSRYENESSYPDDSMTLLLTAAIEMPAVLKWLADRAGVELPMWKQRIRDEAAARRALRAAAARSDEAPGKPGRQAARPARATARA